MLTDEERRAKNSARSKAWREANPDRARAGVRAWVAENRDRKRAGDRAYQKEHRDELTIKQRVRRAAHPEKTREYHRQNYQNKRERVRDSRLMSQYGIGVAEYDARLAVQGGVCALCFAAKPGGRGSFHVDHDHVTGTIRGILCHGCNTALGLLKDDPALLRRAAEYVEASIEQEVTA